MVIWNKQSATEEVPRLFLAKHYLFNYKINSFNVTMTDVPTDLLRIGRGSLAIRGPRFGNHWSHPLMIIHKCQNVKRFSLKIIGLCPSSLNSVSSLCSSMLLFFKHAVHIRPSKYKPNTHGTVATFPLQHPWNSNVIPNANTFLYLKTAKLKPFQFAKPPSHDVGSRFVATLTLWFLVSRILLCRKSLYDFRA